MDNSLANSFDEQGGNADGVKEPTAFFQTDYKESILAKSQEILLTITPERIRGSAFICEQIGTKEGDPTYKKFDFSLGEITKVYVNLNNKSTPIYIQCGEPGANATCKRIILPCFSNHDEIVRLINEAKDNFTMNIMNKKDDSAEPPAYNGYDKYDDPAEAEVDEKQEFKDKLKKTMAAPVSFDKMFNSLRPKTPNESSLTMDEEFMSASTFTSSKRKKAAAAPPPDPQKEMEARLLESLDTNRVVAPKKVQEFHEFDMDGIAIASLEETVSDELKFQEEHKEIAPEPDYEAEQEPRHESKETAEKNTASSPAVNANDGQDQGDFQEDVKEALKSVKDELKDVKEELKEVKKEVKKEIPKNTPYSLSDEFEKATPEFEAKRQENRFKRENSVLQTPDTSGLPAIAEPPQFSRFENIERSYGDINIDLPEPGRGSIGFDDILDLNEMLGIKNTAETANNLPSGSDGNKNKESIKNDGIVGDKTVSDTTATTDNATDNKSGVAAGPNSFLNAGKMATEDATYYSDSLAVAQKAKQDAEKEAANAKLNPPKPPGKPTPITPNKPTAPAPVVVTPPMPKTENSGTETKTDSAMTLAEFEAAVLKLRGMLDKGEITKDKFLAEKKKLLAIL